MDLKVGDLGHYSETGWIVLLSAQPFMSARCPISTYASVQWLTPLSGAGTGLERSHSASVTADASKSVS